MPLIKLTANECSGVTNIDDVPVQTLEPHSARAKADWAINQFQSMLFALNDEQARDAYARLLVGRGFEHVRPESMAP